MSSLNHDVFLLALFLYQSVILFASGKERFNSGQLSYNDQGYVQLKDTLSNNLENVILVNLVKVRIGLSQLN